MKPKAIQIQKLSLQYDNTDVKAIDNLSLEIDQGEVFGLLGPNGAGKTSLISILTGLLRPDSGKIYIDGLELTEKSITQIRQHIGVVPQEYALYPKLTAKENLRFFGAMSGVRKKELEKRIVEGIEKMGLTKFANKKINTFSGGMKRRINLLAGLLHQPKILFLDEPTVGVDVQSKRVIIDYLTSLNRQGVTIIYSSHILHEAQDFCSKVVVLDSGLIQVLGKTKEILISQGKVKTLEEIFIENIKLKNV